MLDLFLRCQGQWRVAVGMGGMTRLGLDYPAIEAAARALDLPWTRESFERLQICEAEALGIWREQEHQR